MTSQAMKRDSNLRSSRKDRVKQKQKVKQKVKLAGKHKVNVVGKMIVGKVVAARAVA
jgi:hypothetical protein